MKNQSQKPYWALWVTIILLLSVVCIQQIHLNKDPEFIPETRIDTFYTPAQHDSFTHTYIKVIKKFVNTPPEYLQPDTDCFKLRGQYTNLLNDYMTNRTYKDSLFIDSNKVWVYPVIEQNKLMALTWSYSFQDRNIIKETTETAVSKKHNQLFIGIGPDVTIPLKVSAHLQLAFKPKKGNTIWEAGYRRSWNSTDQSYYFTYNRLLSLR